jgi:7-cyano-7-deazaguanine synthase
MDSATLLWRLCAAAAGPVHALSVDYGQRHRVELEAAATLAARAGVEHTQTLHVDLSAIGGSPLTDTALDVPAAAEARQAATVVPFRNLLFVTLAAAYARSRGIADIYLAPVQDDQHAYPDCRRSFYDSLEITLRLADAAEPLRLHTPFVGMWKTEVVALGLELGVPYELTHTCYAGTRPACGTCDACVERLAAFRANGVPDPLPYRPRAE